MSRKSVHIYKIELENCSYNDCCTSSDDRLDVENAEQIGLGAGRAGRQKTSSYLWRCEMQVRSAALAGLGLRRTKRTGKRFSHRIIDKLPSRKMEDLGHTVRLPQEKTAQLLRVVDHRPRHTLPFWQCGSWRRHSEQRRKACAVMRKLTKFGVASSSTIRITPLTPLQDS